MKKGGSKTMVMVALLAVLLVSLGYLSMQGIREGLEGQEKDIKELSAIVSKAATAPPVKAALTKKT